MNRRRFCSTVLPGLAALPALAQQKQLPAPQENIKQVLVMFKCHLDVGFVDTQEAIIYKYFATHYPNAIARARQMRQLGDDRYVWTTGSWLLYEYLEQAKGSDRTVMEKAVENGDIAWHALPFTWQSELLDPSAIEGALAFSKTLDSRFGKKTTGAKLTDVPGHTRGLVSPLQKAGVVFLDIGVNSASTPPDVPTLFVWRDPAGASVIVMYHRDEYGGVVPVPDSDVAVAVFVRNDNSGPHTLKEIKGIYAGLRRRFPRAQIRASNLTEIAAAVEPHAASLPLVTNEIGDTWIYGVASDPTKLSRYRELLRLRREWVQQGKLEVGGAVDRQLLSKLTLAAEHTWGTDTKTWLDFDHYTPADLASVRKKPHYQTVAHSWVEKRRDVDESFAELAPPLRQQAEARLSALKPVAPATDGRQRVEPDSVIETQHLRIRLDSKTGAITLLENKETGAKFADPQHPWALFTYQMLSAADYDQFLKSYITVQTDWAPKDFGKPNIARFGAVSKTWNASKSSVFRYRESGSEHIVAELSVGEQAADGVTAWPEKIVLELECPDDKSALSLNLSWFGKRANRLPEALWLTFQPEVRDGAEWSLTKLDQAVSPFDVVPGGNRHMHAVTQPLTYRDASCRLSIESLDAAVVSLGELSPIYFSKELPNLSKGLHYSLFNNGWGTNYVQWFDEDARFRFRVELA